MTTLTKVFTWVFKFDLNVRSRAPVFVNKGLLEHSHLYVLFMAMFTLQQLVTKEAI